jgi:hypothetical protein
MRTRELGVYIYPLCEAFVVNFTTPCREIQDSRCFVMVYTMNFNIHLMSCHCAKHNTFCGVCHEHQTFKNNTNKI